MTSLFEFLKLMDKSVDKVFEYPITSLDGKILGWSTIVRDFANYPYSGGTDAHREIARLKALYEGIERGAIKKMYRLDGESPFYLNKFPTSNGFACGPSEDFAIQKSIFEGFERYLWDLWIDKKISLKNLYQHQLSDYVLFLSQSFEKIEFYGCQFDADFYQPENTFYFTVCIGHYKNGIFWGSNVCNEITHSSFDHSLVEASRNLKSYLANTCKASNNYEDKILQMYGDCGLEKFQPNLSDNFFLNLKGSFEFVQSAELSKDIWIARSLIKGFKEHKVLSRMAFW